MSTIDSLFGNTATNQINPSASANQGIIGAASNDNDGNFASAIAQALAQIGVVPATIGVTDPSTTASSTTATSTTQAQQELQTFLQDLLNNLQSQNSTTTASNSSISGATGATHAHHHHHGGGGLDSLIQELDASSSSTSDSLIADSLTGTTATGGSSTASSSVSTLQQDFQNLLSSVGTSSNQVSLSDFLKTVSNNLHTTQASTATASV